VQSTPKHPPIALLAGRGDLPRLLIKIFQSQKRPFVVLAFHGQTEEDLVADVPHLWLSFGEVGKALRYAKENHVEEIVMAGAMTRPALSEVLPDWEGVKWLAKIGTKALGDDKLLKHVIEVVEANGYRVVAPDDILGDLLALEGTLTSYEPDEQAWRDIARGVDVLSALSPVDVGQAVVVQEGLVLGVEAIEGTDALIKRVGPLQRPGPGGVLVKLAKHQQEQRVDLPTIGPNTIRAVAQAGLRGIAIQAGRSLLLNRAETIKLAQEKGIFLVALGAAQCHSLH
jgi:DUF1009 family protein